MASTATPRDNPATCRLCGAHLEVRIPKARDTDSGDVFSVMGCLSCGLSQTLPIPADLGKYYSAAYHGGRHGFTAQYCVQRRMRWVKKTAGKANIGKLLDIGCGEGTFLLLARKNGWIVAGTEFKPEAARAQALDVRGSLAQVQEQGPFDCITLWHSLEHMPDPVETISHASKLLQPGGFLLVAVPDAGGLQAQIFRDAWLHLDVPRHVFHFTGNSLRRMVREAGLREVHSWHQEFEYDLLGWSQSALNRLLPRPNEFFDELRGCSAERRGSRVLTMLAGFFFSALALPLVAVGTLLRRGGTLVLAAQKPCPS